MHPNAYVGECQPVLFTVRLMRGLGLGKLTNFGSYCDVWAGIFGYVGKWFLPLV